MDLKDQNLQICDKRKGNDYNNNDSTMTSQLLLDNFDTNDINLSTVTREEDVKDEYIEGSSVTEFSDNDDTDNNINNTIHKNKNDDDNSSSQQSLIQRVLELKEHRLYDGAILPGAIAESYASKTTAATTVTTSKSHSNNKNKNKPSELSITSRIKVDKYHNARNHNNGKGNNITGSRSSHKSNSYQEDDNSNTTQSMVDRVLELKEHRHSRATGSIIEPGAVMDYKSAIGKMMNQAIITTTDVETKQKMYHEMTTTTTTGTLQAISSHQRDLAVEEVTSNTVNDNNQMIEMESFVNNNKTLLNLDTEEGNNSRPSAEFVRGPGYVSTERLSDYSSDDGNYNMHIQDNSSDGIDNDDNDNSPMVQAELVCDENSRVIDEFERMRIVEEVTDRLTSNAVNAEAITEGEHQPFYRRPFFYILVCLLIVVLIIGVVIGVVVGSDDEEATGSIPLLPTVAPTIAPTNAPTTYLSRPSFFQTTQQLYDAVDLYLEALDQHELETSIVYARFGNIEEWNVSAVTDLTRVFDLDRYEEDQIDIFRTPRYINLFDADLSKWDVQRATTLQGMFASAIEFQGRGLEKWDVSKVKDFSFLFFQCYSFNNSNISNWNTSSGTITEEMFTETYNFDSDLGNFDMSRVTDASGMFSNSKYIGRGVEKWDVSKLIWMENIFDSSQFAGDVSQWNTSSAESLSGMFAYSKFDGTVTGFTTDKVTDMAYMFAGTDFDGDLSHFNTSSVQEMYSMFQDSSYSGRNGDISKWDVSRCIFMDAMFSGADNFNQDISEWDVRKVKSFSSMFQGTEQFSQSLCAWNNLISDSANVENMFTSTSCPDQSQPVVSDGGPFCYQCR